MRLDSTCILYGYISEHFLEDNLESALQSSFSHFFLGVGIRLKNDYYGETKNLPVACSALSVTVKYLKKLYGPFLWVGFGCLKATQPLRGGRLLCTPEFPVIPGTQPPSGFELGTPTMEIQRLNH